MDHSRRTCDIVELALNSIHPGLKPVHPDLKPVHPGFNPVHPGLKPVHPDLKPVHPALNAGHLILEPLLDFGDLLVDGWENYEYLEFFRKRRTDQSDGGQMSDL